MSTGLELAIGVLIMLSVLTSFTVLLIAAVVSAWRADQRYPTSVPQRWWRRLRQGPVPDPVIERRLRVCNMGSIFGGEKGEWCADPDGDEAAVAFREKYSDLKCYPCRTSHYDWEMHQRHLIVDERTRGEDAA